MSHQRRPSNMQKSKILCKPKPGRIQSWILRKKPTRHVSAPAWSPSHVSRNSQRAWKPLWLFAEESFGPHPPSNGPGGPGKTMLGHFVGNSKLNGWRLGLWGYQETNVNVNYIQRIENVFFSIFTPSFLFIILRHNKPSLTEIFEGFSINEGRAPEIWVWGVPPDLVTLLGQGWLHSNAYILS